MSLYKLIEKTLHSSILTILLEVFFFQKSFMIEWWVVAQKFFLTKLYYIGSPVIDLLTSLFMAPKIYLYSLFSLLYAYISFSFIIFSNSFSDTKAACFLDFNHFDLIFHFKGDLLILLSNWVFHYYIHIV